VNARFGFELAGPALAASVHDATMFVQPIGAVEHHGAHLPLGTDSIVVEELAKALIDERRDLDLVMLPTLSYGLSTEHVWAPGTVTLSATTVLSVLQDVAASVVRAGGRRLAFFNGHGGNTNLLRLAIREIRATTGLETFIVAGGLPPDTGGPPSDDREEGLGIHGGISETSMVLYLRPDLVDMEKAERSVPSWVHAYRHVGFGKAAEFAWLSSDLSPSGVAGDPTLATAELGKENFIASVTGLSAVFDELMGFHFPVSSTT
jgi:creatinine amidohydrolase